MPKSLSAAPRTPAERLIELEQEIRFLSLAIDDKDAELSRLKARDARWHSMRDTSFGGIPMAQVWADLILWEALLNENPELRGIVEIGTWQGGFSLWLQAQSVVRGLHFKTMDSIVHFNETTKWLLDDSQSGAYPGQISDFEKVDVFADSERIGAKLHEWEPLVLFCDGGNKPRELRTFPPYLTDPLSLVVVHDWGTETLPSDVPDTLEEVYGDFCDELGSISRVFRVRQ